MFHRVFSQHGDQLAHDLQTKYYSQSTKRSKYEKFNSTHKTINTVSCRQYTDTHSVTDGMKVWQEITSCYLFSPMKAHGLHILTMSIFHFQQSAVHSLKHKDSPQLLRSCSHHHCWVQWAPEAQGRPFPPYLPYSSDPVQVAPAEQPGSSFAPTRKGTDKIDSIGCLNY